MPTPCPQPPPERTKTVDVGGAAVTGAAQAATAARAARTTRRTSRRIRAGVGLSRLRLKALRVLLLVVAAVLAGLDGLPPGAVREISFHGLAQAALAERVPRRPPEAAELRVVERVAPVVARAVLDVADERQVGPGELEDPVGDLEVLVVLAADVVDGARLALVEDELDRGAVV